MKNKALTGIIAVILCAVMGISLPLQSYAASSGNEQYLSDLKAVSGKESDAEKLKAELSNAGYQVLDKDLNDDKKQSSFLGYKTTANKEEALTDIKLMNMNGDYSYSDYEVMQEKQRGETQELIDSLVPAVEEYRVNYGKGDLKAISAHDLLNKFYDDDTDSQLGDFLLECSLKPGARDEIETIFLQGNSEIILAVQQTLAMAVDPAKDTFLDRMQKKDYDTMLDEYEEKYGTMREARNNLALEYDDAAQLVLNAWDDFYASIQNYLASETGRTENEDLDEVVSTMDEVAAASALSDRFVYQYLESLPYGDGTFFDYFNRPSEEVDIEEIYPLVASLSEGQRADITAMTIYSLVSNAVTDKISDQNTSAAMKQVVDAVDAVSVYSGVDRALFDGGVALTGEATKADAKSGSGGWQKPFEAAEDYYWAIGIATFVSFATYLVTTSRINRIISTAARQTLNTLDDIMGKAPQMIVSRIEPTFGNILTRQFNLGTGTKGVSTSLVSMHKVAFVLSAVMVFANAALLAYEIYKLCHDEEIEYINIPGRMVHYTSDEDATHYIKYNCASDTKDVCTDLYNFSRKEWLALYYTTDASAGTPIKASSLEILSNDTIPAGKKPVTLFDSGSIENISRLSKGSAYLVFAGEEASFAGTAFSGAASGIGFGVAVIAAFVIAYVFGRSANKKKKEDTAKA